MPCVSKLRSSWCHPSPLSQMVAWDDGTHWVAMWAWDVFPIHLVRENDIPERVDGLVEGEGAAVLVPDFIVVVRQQADLGCILWWSLRPQGNGIDIHA